MNVPRVSVVIPCYNHGGFIQEAVASVRSQTFPDWEIVIVDDGSTDQATIDVLDGLAGEKVCVLRTPNYGPAAARNAAIEQALGEFILPLDADDRIAPRYLELAVAAMDRAPQVRVVCGRVEFFGVREGEWRLPDYSLARLLLDNMLVATSLFRRCDWEMAGGYREEMRGWEDWEFWLSVLGAGGIAERIDEVLFYYRIRHDSRDRTLNLWDKLGLMLKMVRRHRAIYLGNWQPVLGLLLNGATHGRQA
jgi:glycosyltransferase involved in cell wall biosynthesis